MRRALLLTAVLVAALVPREAAGYSVLAHEAMIDTAWPSDIVPLLRARFPGVSNEEIRQARAYAYGGSLIQDLGYYPFGSKFFSNLVHYVHSGEFVTALVRGARDVNEYAFALGALAHYATDTIGHRNATNRVVPMVYPKLRAEHGPEVLYAHSPARHIMVEFAFDVLQIARGTFKSDVYQELIGFQVATPLLARGFRDTYGLELTDVFGDVDQAISTYRKAASEIVPQVTRLAWRDKREEILEANPTLSEGDVVFAFTPAEFDETYGTNYRKPGFLARMIVIIGKLIPKVGPLRPLAFEPLTADTERMFLDSFAAARVRYVELLGEVREGRTSLGDTDLDTGAAPQPGLNPLADETVAELREELAKRQSRGTRLATN